MEKWIGQAIALISTGAMDRLEKKFKGYKVIAYKVTDTLIRADIQILKE